MNTKTIVFNENTTPPSNWIWQKEDGQFYENNGHGWEKSDTIESAEKQTQEITYGDLTDLLETEFNGLEKESGIIQSIWINKVDLRDLLVSWENKNYLIISPNDFCIKIGQNDYTDSCSDFLYECNLDAKDEYEIVDDIGYFSAFNIENFSLTVNNDFLTSYVEKYQISDEELQNVKLCDILKDTNWPSDSTLFFTAQEI